MYTPKIHHCTIIFVIIDYILSQIFLYFLPQIFLTVCLYFKSFIFINFFAIFWSQCFSLIFLHLLSFYCFYIFNYVYPSWFIFQTQLFAYIFPYCIILFFIIIFKSTLINLYILFSIFFKTIGYHYFIKSLINIYIHLFT